MAQGVYAVFVHRQGAVYKSLIATLARLILSQKAKSNILVTEVIAQASAAFQVRVLMSLSHPNPHPVL